MRLIDADVLHKAYMELRNFKQDPQSGDWISLRAVPLTTVIRMLNDAPSIDIEPKRGEWIESFKSVETRQGAYLGTKFVHDGWSCSECSEVVEKRYPNCPYCLARMKGADDE